MRRISTPTAAQDLFGPGKHGFRNGDPANAILATRLEAAFFNALQEEVAGLVEQAGIALDPEDNTQLLKAVRKLRGGAVNFGFWQWSAVGANPAAGRVTLNNADPALASSLLIAESSAESLDYSPSLGMLRAGDTLSLQERDALDVSHRFRVAGPAVDHGAYREIPVSYVTGSGGAPAVDAMLSVLLTQAGASDAAVPLFSVQWWPSRASIPAGYAPADGQALPRATFPDAWAGIQAGNVPTVAEATWQATPAQRGKYTVGDGASTFRLPDYNGKAVGSLGAVFLRGDGALSAAISGAIQSDAFQGHSFASAMAYSQSAGYSLHGDLRGVPYYNAGGGVTPNIGNNWDATVVGVDSWSLSGGYLVADGVNGTPRVATETRPLNVTGCWIVKLFGAVTNPGSADAAQLATDYAALVGRVAVLEGLIPAAVLHVRDEKASGTNGGSFTSGAWRTRDLNTVKANTIAGASVAANQMTLPAGTYEIQAGAPAVNVSSHQARLYNVTAAVTVLDGRNELSGGGGVGAPSVVLGRFTLAAPSVLELQHACQTTAATTGFGQSSTLGGLKAVEVYSDVIIKKVG